MYRPLVSINIFFNPAVTAVAYLLEHLTSQQGQVLMTLTVRRGTDKGSYEIRGLNLGKCIDKQTNTRKKKVFSLGQRTG